MADTELRDATLAAAETPLLGGTAEDESDLLAAVAEHEAERGEPIGRRLLLIGACVIGAVVAIWLGIVGLSSQSGFVRVVIAAIGLGCAFKAFEALGRIVRGPRFDAGLILSISWLCVIVLAAVFADLLPLGNYKDTTASLTQVGNLPPDLLSSHPLGTNNFGLDILARVIYAARVSLLTCLFAAMISVLLGGAIGLLAGYFRGWLDVVINIFTDAWLAVPGLVILLAAAAVVGPPTTAAGAVVKVGIPLALVGLSTMVRVARANTLTFAQREFVTASRALGASHTRVLIRELAPNVLVPLLSYAFTLLAVFIVAEGSLSYLGLGLQQPTPSWGNMIAEGGITDLREHPHVQLIPGLVMFLTVFAFSRVGDKLRAGWDTKGVQI